METLEHQNKPKNTVLEENIILFLGINNGSYQ